MSSEIKTSFIFDIFRKDKNIHLSPVYNGIGHVFENEQGVAHQCINRSKCTACTEKVYSLTGWVYRTAWILSGKPSKGLPLRTCKEPVP